MGAKSITSRIRSAKRLTQVINVFARHGYWSIVERSRLQTTLSKSEKREIEEQAVNQSDESPIGLTPAARLRTAFEELGPAYVKLGQILASRDDLIPANLVAELSKLHSDVKPMPFADIRAIISQQLPAKVAEKIISIQDTPLAAGSIGQVHLATLSDGQNIVLKVQRPGIRKIIKADLELMAQIAVDLEKYVPELRPYRPSNIINELTNALEGELDYLREAANTEKIRENFINDDGLVLPSVYWDLTSQKVLALEYLRGEKIPHVAHPDAAVIIERGLEMFIKMVAIDGEYHGDLHAGNLLIMPENKLGVIDFGLTVRLSRTQKLLITEIFVSLIEGDCDRLARAMAELGEPSSDFNFEAYSSDLLNSLGPYLGGQIRQMKSSRLLMDFSKVSARHGIPVPRALFLVLKTLASFESVGRRLDPEFDVMGLCASQVDVLKDQIHQGREIKNQLESLARDIASLTRIAPYHLRKILKSAADGDLRLNVSNESTIDLSNQISRAASRIAVSVILSATILASSILVSVSNDWQNLGIAGYILSGLLGLYVVLSMIFNRRQ